MASATEARATPATKPPVPKNPLANLDIVEPKDANGLPYINGFKASHLARNVLDSGQLSSQGYISFKGNVTRSDGIIYYGLSTSAIENITAETIINGGSQFLHAGNYAQTTKDVNIQIEGLEKPKSDIHEDEEEEAEEY